MTAGEFSKLNQERLFKQSQTQILIRLTVYRFLCFIQQKQKEKPEC